MAAFIDQLEITKFNKLAKDWWEPNGTAKILHAINFPRLEFINQHTNIFNKKILDIGCGGGILTESLAKAGAIVTGVDAAADMLTIAKKHALEQNISINYLQCPIEELSPKIQTKFDIITCMEVLEHLSDFSIVINTCQQLLKPEGIIFLSTINRTSKAYLVAILGAEYILKLMPKHTHTYAKFIKPCELMSALNKHDFKLNTIAGINYDPLRNQAKLTVDASVNYVVSATLYN